MSNLGVYADFSEESFTVNKLDFTNESGEFDEDKFEKWEVEQERKEILKFIEENTIPEVENDENFWMNLMNKFSKKHKVNGLVLYGYMNFDIIIKMYKNLTDKTIIRKCGKKLNKSNNGNTGFECMMVHLSFLSELLIHMNANSKISSVIRVIEVWWDGIGKWQC